MSCNCCNCCIVLIFVISKFLEPRYNPEKIYAIAQLEAIANALGHKITDIESGGSGLTPAT